MSVTLNIVVNDSLTDVLALYDQIQILRADVATDPFVEITGVGTRLVLTSTDSLYTYIDATGTAGQLYKTRYYNSITDTVGTSTQAFQPVAEGADISTDLKDMTVLWSSVPQLFQNMRVSVTLDSTISDTAGTELGTDTTFYFLTQLNPLYASFRELELEIGAYISDVQEDTAYLQLFKASLDADALTFSTVTNNNAHFKYVRKNWVLCRAEELTLLNQMEGTAVATKRLGDLMVTYNTDAIRAALQRAVMCQRDLIPLLKMRGQTPGMRTVVKGQDNPDTPLFGRGMISTSPYGVPAMNGRALSKSNPFAPADYGRRYSGTYIKGGIRW